MSLVTSGVVPERRFAFFDQVWHCGRVPFLDDGNWAKRSPKFLLEK